MHTTIQSTTRSTITQDPIKPDCFWVNPFVSARLCYVLFKCSSVLPSLTAQGLHFTLIQPEDLLLVDHDGKILEESGPLRRLNLAAFMIHSAIHKSRPDVMCAAHSHSIYGRSFSTLGKELDIITQDSCAFYKVSHLSLSNIHQAL